MDNTKSQQQQSSLLPEYSDRVKSWLEAEVAKLDGGEKRAALIEMLQLLYSSPEVSRYVNLWRVAYSDGRY